MMLDRTIALLAIIMLTVFLGVAAVRVGRADLAIAIGITLAFACYDLWRQLFPNRR